MSGFEVAGVVLGSLPLIISALEHYAEGIATAKRFWRYKTELRSLILQVNTERGIFINTLEQLLTGIMYNSRRFKRQLRFQLLSVYGVTEQIYLTAVGFFLYAVGIGQHVIEVV